MNKSYSKIRHIQESNQRLENRLLNEQPMDDFQSKSIYKKLVDYGDTMDQQYKKIKNIREELDYLIKKHLNSGTITDIFDHNKRTPNDIIETVSMFNKNMNGLEETVNGYKRMVKNSISF